MAQRETQAGIAGLTGAASGAMAGTAIMPGIGTAVGALAGGLISGLGSYFGDTSDDEAKAAAKLTDDQARQQLMWTSAINANHDILYGTDGKGGLLNEYATFKQDQIARGITNPDSVINKLTAFESQYLPIYADMAGAAQKASAQLASMAGTSLGDSKLYIDQLQAGTQALNARLASQGLLKSSSGNDAYMQFAQSLGASVEASRQKLLQDITNTGLQASQQAAQLSEFGTSTRNQVNQDIMQANQFGTQAGLTAAQMTNNLAAGQAGQNIQQQQLSGTQLINAQNRGDMSTAAPYQIVGDLSNTAIKGAKAFGLGGARPMNTDIYSSKMYD